MSSSKRISLCWAVSLLLGTALTLPAQNASFEDIPRSLRTQLAAYLTQADFSYVTDDAVPVSGEGRLYVQDSCYVLDMGLMKISSDGIDRWTVDADAREVYVEKAVSIAGAVAGFTVEKFDGLSSGGVKARLLAPDGRRITLTVPKMKMTAKAEADFFRVNTAALPSDWIITDLRQ